MMLSVGIGLAQHTTCCEHQTTSTWCTQHMELGLGHAANSTQGWSGACCTLWMGLIWHVLQADGDGDGDRARARPRHLLHAWSTSVFMYSTVLLYILREDSMVIANTVDRIQHPTARTLWSSPRSAHLLMPKHEIETIMRGQITCLIDWCAGSLCCSEFHLVPIAA